jgi:hypothetical protein
MDVDRPSTWLNVFGKGLEKLSGMERYKMQAAGTEKSEGSEMDVDRPSTWLNVLMERYKMQAAGTEKSEGSKMYVNQPSTLGDSLWVSVLAKGLKNKVD